MATEVQACVVETDDVYLTLTEVALWLKRSERSVWRDVSRGILPRPFKLSGADRWVKAELVQALDKLKKQRDGGCEL